MTKLPDDFGVQPSFAELQKAAMDPGRLTEEFATCLEGLATYFRRAAAEERGAAAVRELTKVVVLLGDEAATKP
jgi:hypothetical protein